MKKKKRFAENKNNSLADPVPSGRYAGLRWDQVPDDELRHLHICENHFGSLVREELARRADGGHYEELLPCTLCGVDLNAMEAAKFHSLAASTMKTRSQRLAWILTNIHRPQVQAQARQELSKYTSGE